MKAKACTTKAKRRSPRKASSAARPQIRLTNPDRVLYPERGITKLDLANYYAQIVEWILPHVSDRPLTLVRCPDGLSGKCFYQKHPPIGISSSVEQISIREKDEVGKYAVVHDLEGLLGLVQFGVLEIHAWGSRSDDIERPDRLVFDLDPDPSVPWKRVVDAAFLVRDTLDELRLQAFVKTTGGKGLHVVVPIQRKDNWPQVKEFSRAVAERIARAVPDQFVTNMSKAARRGKIFIDYLRNERGATSVVAFSTRAKLGATVSTPVDWKELRSLAGPSTFDVHNVPQRLAKLKQDPWGDLVLVRQSITQATKKNVSLR